MFESTYSPDEIFNAKETKCINVKNMNMDKFYRYVTSTGLNRLSIKAVIMPDNFQLNEENDSKIPFKNIFPNCEAIYWPNINVVPPLFFKQSAIKTIIMHSCKTIYNKAFEGSQIENIIIPSDCTAIAEGAFSGCKYLTTVDFSNANISLGESAFINCINLKKIKRVNGLQGIGAYAFTNTALTTITLPESIIYIGISVFYNCSKLKKATLKNMKINRISQGLFQDCVSLEEVQLNSQYVTHISNNVFDNCKKLKKITGMDNVKFIDCFAFRFTKLTEFIAPKSLMMLNISAFVGCSKLRTVDLSQASYLDSIEDYVFFGTGLKSIIFPKSITKIKEGAFASSELECINIPDSVRLVEKKAFKDCPVLNSVCWSKQCLEIKSETFSNTPMLSLIENLDSITKIGKQAFSESNPNLYLKLTNLKEFGRLQFESFKGVVDLTENPNLNYNMNILKGNIDDIQRKFSCQLKLPYYVLS